jgi:glycosyltransferase involved in cell wall biosynthesis
VNRLPITVAMIAGAEASRIGRALESVADWAGEIVIVLNADVNDGTGEIAVRHGAKVFREPWKGFRDQKNSAAQKAGHDWILSLDADEVVSPELRKEIEGVVRETGFVAYDMPRLSWCCGRWIRHGDWYPDRQIRLWRKGAAQWGGGTVHEKLAVSGPLGHLRGDLLHFSMDSLDRHLSRISEYSNCFAKDWLAQGRKPGLFDLAVRPLWRFMRCYFLRLGFLDGWVGFYLAWQTAFACLTRYAKVREALASCPTSPSSSSPATPAR